VTRALQNLVIAALVFVAAAFGADMAGELWIRQPHPENRTVVCGKTGQGKSVWTRAYLEPVRRVAIFDPKRDHTYVGLQMNTYEFAERAREFADWGVLRVQVVPYDYGNLKGSRLVKGRLVLGEHELFCRTCLSIGRLLAAHEEVLYFAAASPGETGTYFGEMIASGRHEHVSMLVTGQRLSMFPTLYRDNASRVIAYRMGSKSVPALGEVLDGGAGAELAPYVTRLPDHHFIEWTPAEGARIHAPLRLG
jgi:hypothetical protein